MRLYKLLHQYGRRAATAFGGGGFLSCWIPDAFGDSGPTDANPCGIEFSVVVNIEKCLIASRISCVRTASIRLNWDSVPWHSGIAVTRVASEMVVLNRLHHGACNLTRTSGASAGSKSRTVQLFVTGDATRVSQLLPIVMTKNESYVGIRLCAVARWDPLMCGSERSPMGLVMSPA